MINDNVWDYDGIREIVLNFINEKFMENNKETISFEYPLLEKGIIDSLSMLTIILFMEEKFGLDFYKIEAKRDNFHTINTIADLVYENVKN